MEEVPQVDHREFDDDTVLVCVGETSKRQTKEPPGRGARRALSRVYRIHEQVVTLLVTIRNPAETGFCVKFHRQWTKVLQVSNATRETQVQFPGVGRLHNRSPATPGALRWRCPIQKTQDCRFDHSCMHSDNSCPTGVLGSAALDNQASGSANRRGVSPRTPWPGRRTAIASHLPSDGQAQGHSGKKQLRRSMCSRIEEPWPKEPSRSPNWVVAPTPEAGLTTGDSRMVPAGKAGWPAGSTAWATVGGATRWPRQPIATTPPERLSASSR